MVGGLVWRRALRVGAAVGHAPSLRLSPLTASAATALLQRRAFASSPADEDRQLVYEGPMARAVRLMKGVSVTSCALTTVGMPVLCYMSEQSTSVIGKWAMCGTIMLFGLGTTSLYHVLFEPYVLRMWIDSQKAPLGNDTLVTVESLTLLAQRKTTQFTLGDVTRPVSSMHPMVSFRAKDANFFIHPEVIQDEELVKKLMGDDFQVVKKDSSKGQEEDFY